MSSDTTTTRTTLNQVQVDLATPLTLIVFRGTRYDESYTNHDQEWEASIISYAELLGVEVNPPLRSERPDEATPDPLTHPSPTPEGATATRITRGLVHNVITTSGVIVISDKLEGVHTYVNHWTHREDTKTNVLKKKVTFSWFNF